MAPKSSLSPSDKALQPGMRVRCVGGVHVSVSGLGNICTLVPRKSFLLWALLQKTSFLAFTTVPCSLGLPRCLTQPEDKELRSFLCTIPCDPQAWEQPAWGTAPLFLPGDIAGGAAAAPDAHPPPGLSRGTGEGPAAPLLCAQPACEGNPREKTTRLVLLSTADEKNVQLNTLHRK